MNRVTQYLEVDSTYRNRTDYPVASNFQLHYDLGQQVNKMTAKDPVSDQSLIMRWRINNFCIDSNNEKISYGIVLKPRTKMVGPGLVPTNGYNLHILKSVVEGGLQPITNYYNGAILHISDPLQSIRIVEYNYMGNNICSIRTEEKIMYDSESVLQIVDPSTACDSSLTIDKEECFLFVPGGSCNSIYNYYELYDITKSLSFRVDLHESKFDMIKIDSHVSKQIGACDWVELRKVIPRLRNNLDFINYNYISATINKLSFPFKSGQRSIAQSGDFIEVSKDLEYGTAEFFSIQNQIKMSNNASLVHNAYVGCTMRIICSNLTSSTSEDRTIIKYEGDTKIATFSKSFINDLSLYTKLEYIVFPLNETNRIKNVINQVLRVSKMGDNKLDLKSNFNTFVSLVPGFYKDYFINQDIEQKSLYGYIIDHIVNFDLNGVLISNILLVNPEFYNTINDSLSISVNSCQLFEPFKRQIFSNTNNERFVILEYAFDNHVHIKGSSYCYGQEVRRVKEEYKINLVTLVLPNLQLCTGHGGFITEYPFVYVTLCNSDFTPNQSQFMSNSRNASGMSFKVMITNTLDPTKRFIHLSCDMPNFVFLDLTKDLRFAVYLPDGTLFTTVEKDLMSPYNPNNTLQINALFTLQRVSNEITNGKNNGINFDTYTRR